MHLRPHRDFELRDIIPELREAGRVNLQTEALHFIDLQFAIAIAIACRATQDKTTNANIIKSFDEAALAAKFARQTTKNLRARDVLLRP